MLEQVKVGLNIRKNDIVGDHFRTVQRENAKVIRINKQKEEIVVELLEAASTHPDNRQDGCSQGHQTGKMIRRNCEMII